MEFGQSGEKPSEKVRGPTTNLTHRETKRLLSKLENICYRHECLKKPIRHDTNFGSSTNVVRGGKQEKICVLDNVSSLATAQRFKETEVIFS